MVNVKSPQGFRNTSDFDVVVSDVTDISVTTVPFTATPPLLRQISTMPPAQNIAVIEARITAIASTTQAVTVRGSEKKLRHATIFDGTARILLQLWEKHTDAVQLHRSYRFTDLSPRKYQGQLQLTTTFDTAVEIIADLDAPDTSCDSLKPALMSATGTVRALQTETSMQCFFCNSKQDNIDARSKFHWCQQCKLNQKSDSYGQLFSGTMMLTTNNGILHLKISPETFTAYFNAHNLKRTLEDELEEHFLSQSHVSVTFDDENQLFKIFSRRVVFGLDLDPAAEPDVEPSTQQGQETLPE
ncbi:hypothetical protein SRHO_G00099810 [Serrasalmus rhombeus]